MNNESAAFEESQLKHSRIYCIIESNKRKGRYMMSLIVKHIEVAYQER
jgi:hypothetical protein